MSRLKICRPVHRAATEGPSGGRVTRKTLWFLGLTAVVLGTEACASGAPSVPTPRPIVVHSGARIRADEERMAEINEWLLDAQVTIEEDPSFLLIRESTLEEILPWEGMELGNDSVTVQIPLGGQDATLVYDVYGFLHLMHQMGRQDEWLPEAPDAVGYDLERAIVARIADAWILGRSVFDTQPFGPLDELAYAKDSGYLDAYIFTARPEEFATARTEWARENPGQVDAYREWFLETFNREPPGLRPG